MLEIEKYGLLVLGKKSQFKDSLQMLIWCNANRSNIHLDTNDNLGINAFRGFWLVHQFKN